AKARVVTVAMEGLSFFQPVEVGDTVACYAWGEKIGRTAMTIAVEVWVERFRERGTQVLVTRGVFVYVAVDDGGRPIPVQRDDAYFCETAESDPVETDSGLVPVATVGSLSIFGG